MLEARGRLYSDAAADLQEILGKALAEARLVVLDLQGVTAIDPLGVYVIVRANREALQEGRRLVLIRAPAHVDAAFKLDGTDGGLTVVESSARAVVDPRLDDTS